MSMEEIEISEYSEPQKTGYIDAIKKGYRAAKETLSTAKVEPCLTVKPSTSTAIASV